MSAPDANGWMPIETAPRDGRTVLLWDTDVEHHELARWSKGNSCWHKPEWGHGADEEPPPGEDMIGITVYLPTHWQPLPKPPANPHEGG